MLMYIYAPEVYIHAVLSREDGLAVNSGSILEKVVGFWKNRVLDFFKNSQSMGLHKYASPGYARHGLARCKQCNVFPN